MKAKLIREIPPKNGLPYYFVQYEYECIDCGKHFFRGKCNKNIVPYCLECKERRMKKALTERRDIFMFQELCSGNYFYYKLEGGGAGIVYAESPEKAEQKVKNAYRKHSSGEYDHVDIYDIYQKPFDDTPDVIEIYEH